MEITKNKIKTLYPGQIDSDRLTEDQLEIMHLILVDDGQELPRRLAIGLRNTLYLVFGKNNLMIRPDGGVEYLNFQSLFSMKE